MSTETESTHFVFDGKQIQISPNIRKIFDFLVEIEKESEEIFGVEKKLQEFRDYFRDLLGCTAELSKVLKDNNIDDWSYTFKKDPRTVSDVLKYRVPVRSQMILLFTQLEVLFFLYIAYAKEVDTDNDLRSVAMRDEQFRKGFLRDFLIGDNNDYFKANKSRLDKLDAGKIIRLRNSLVHFFSLPSDSIGIHPEQFKDDARKFEKYASDNKKGSLVMMSPNDLHELIKGAYMVMFKLWTNDTYTNNEVFKRKIQYVNNVVSNAGAVVLYYNNKNDI
jgi:hypothetical protein